MVIFHCYVSSPEGKNCASNLPSCRNPPDVFWDAEGIEEAGDLGELGDFHSGGTPIGGGTPH